jgi:hypothetical protein
MSLKRKEDLKDENFNFKNYMEQELSDIIKTETMSSSSAYLTNLIEAMNIKKSNLNSMSSVLTQKAAIDKSKNKASQTNKIIKGLEQEYNGIFDKLSSTEASIRDDVKFTKILKKRIDRILLEKERINSELFVLDLIRDMKMNDKNFDHLKNFEDKMKFAKSIKEIESQIMMYEKSILSKFYELQLKIEQDFIDMMNSEISANKYVHTSTIIDYFKNLGKEDVIFQSVCEHFIIKINFHGIPNFYNKQNVDNISLMIGNFFGVIEKFFDKRLYAENDLLNFFDEEMFNKLTGYFFEKCLSRYFDIVLMKNLKGGYHEFFLEYMERIHEIFLSYSPQFETVKSNSIFLYELIYAYKSAALSKFYEEYFAIEEKNFIYFQGIYINFLKEKLVSNFGTKKAKGQFEEIFELLKNEKFEEYFNFIKKSMTRAATLCDSSFLALNITKLIKNSLEKFEGFFSFIIDNLKMLVPLATQDKTFVSPETFRISAFLYVGMLRMNIDQKHYIENVKFSIYFSEINLLRKGIFDNLKKKLEEFVNRCVTNVLENISLNLKVTTQSSSSKNQVEVSIFAQVKRFLEPYVRVINEYVNPEFKKTVEVILFRNAIQLLEMQLLNMEQKVKDKFNFQNELAPFFEIFQPVEHKELVGDINALRYLLLFLKSKEKDIYQTIELTHKDLVNTLKLEMYQAELNKRK